MKDLTVLNSRVSPWGYNCAGFALGTFRWEKIYAFEDFADDEGMDPGEILNMMAQEIEAKFPYLIRVPSHHNIPKRYKVIGLKIGDIEEWGYDWSTDFHFVMRYRGKWYHKQGKWDIEPLPEKAIEKDCWGDIYNSETAWFVDMTNRVNQRDPSWDL